MRYEVVAHKSVWFKYKVLAGGEHLDYCDTLWGARRVIRKHRRMRRRLAKLNGDLLIHTENY